MFQEGITGHRHYAGGGKIQGRCIRCIMFMRSKTIKVISISEKMFIMDVTEETGFEKGVAERDGFLFGMRDAFGD